MLQPVAGESTCSLRMEALMPASDRERINACLERFLDRGRARFAANPRLAEIYDEAAAFALQGGKRVRPRLCLAAYRVLSGRPADPPPAVWRVASLLEILHAFMLVHDDLIDESATRRGRDTLHERYRVALERRSDRPAKRGADLGLIAGDLLFALGLRMLGASGLRGRPLAESLRFLSRMLVETGMGQALDVLHDDLPIDAVEESQINEAYLWKTARYTVSGPLALGAILAGAPPRVRRGVQRFGDLLGFGYQIRNDLEALRVDPLRDECPDLDGGKRTYVLWRAHRDLDEHSRARLRDALELPPGPDRRARLLELIHSSGAPETCARLLRELRADAARALAESALDPARREDFLLLAQIFAEPAGIPT